MRNRELDYCHASRLAAMLICALILSISAAILHADNTTGKIEGTITSSDHQAIGRALIILRNTETGETMRTQSDESGWYALRAVPVGRYALQASATGFRTVMRSGIQIDIAATPRLNLQLEVGAHDETVQVIAPLLLLELSSTQTGQVLNRAAIETLPLNGRSYTDLLALQAGVTPSTTLTSSTVQGLGQNVFDPSGTLNPGVLSINGQRESANAYVVNGANAEESGSRSAALVPNLDSIDEFRILVGNFDAEFGRSSGGQVHVITRSGKNNFHGSGYEFLRNTSLDARNYYSLTRSRYQQNQYGGVLGGPIRRDHIFFFADIEHTHQLQGADSGLIPVPSAEAHQGDLTSMADELTGSVGGSYWASLLGTRLGYSVSQNEPYYSSNCQSTSECVFPQAMIPQSAWSAPAKILQAYIPTPNASSSEYSTSAYNKLLDDTKGALRLDLDSSQGRSSIYFSLDNYQLDDPYPTAQGGANLPGFDALSVGHAYLLVLAHEKTFLDQWQTQTHLSYTRVDNDMGTPHGGLGTTLAEQGFTTGANTLGIVAGAPSLEGIESVAFNNYTIGTDPNPYHQINNTYELSVDLSRAMGHHLLKAGAHIDHDEINVFPAAQLNGSFQFYGSETGSDFADFLLGIASQYNQNGLRPFYQRENYFGAYVEDEWHANAQLTINLGMRWERIEPWWEKYNNAMTLIAGEQSVVFPTAPEGIVYPGDPGIARSLAPARSANFSPRAGIAWSPAKSTQSGWMHHLIGEEGRSSIRLGFGIYYAVVPGETLGLISDNAPYGFTYTSPALPLFDTPFIDAETGNEEGQRFPADLAPLTVSSRNPDSDVDWARFEPISAVPGYDPTNRTAYAEQYMISYQRQMGKSTVFDITYAGNEAHRMLVLKAANPGNAALCLSLSQINEVAAGSPTCGPFGESTVYTTAAGVEVNGTRAPLGPAFGSVSTQKSSGNSSYNALQSSLRMHGRDGDLNVAYTYSKTIDLASNFGDQVNPVNQALSRELASFDLRQNLVASYVAQLPAMRWRVLPQALTSGWELGGIARFSTGFPVTLLNYSDSSLWGTQSNGVNNLPADEPNYTRGPLHINHNPRNGNAYFNTDLFSLPDDGDAGNARRRFFSGPGMMNFDMSLQKAFVMTHALKLLLRVEAFNLFNHAQFFGPQSVNGNRTDSTEFGKVVSAGDPRLLQVAAKINF